MSYIGHMLNRTVTVQRASVATSAGTSATTFSAHLSGVAARVHQLSGSEAARFGAERGTNFWRVSVEPSNDIVRTDRILFTDPDGSSHTLDVTAVRNSSNGFNSLAVIKVIDAEEVT